jgi:hypothetical protein
VLLDQLSYLLAFYWPYLLGALGVGLVVGWLSYAGRKG